MGNSIQITTSHRGVATVYVMVAMVVLMGIATLVVDLARVRLAKGELQLAADAAARYGALGLSNGTAFTKAASIAVKNSVDCTPVVLQSGDVESGNWDSALSPQFSTARTPVNAIRITARRTSARGNALPLYFSPWAGTQDVSATAVAVCLSSGYGMVGLDWIDLNSNISTDSYRSAAGAYDAATAGQGGSLASNGKIKLNNITINRDLYMRPGQELDSNNSTYGSRVDLAANIAVPAPTAGSYPTTNDNALITPSGARSGTTFDANSMTVVIPGGNYYFTFFKANSSTINVTGAATIYVNGKVDINGVNFSVAGNKPSNLTFKLVGNSGDDFKVNSISNMWADIQAPKADVNFNSAIEHFYGRIIGKTLKMNSNTKVHIDQSIPAMSGASDGGTAVTLTLVK